MPDVLHLRQSTEPVDPAHPELMSSEDWNNPHVVQNGAITNDMLAAGIDAAKVADGSVSNAEFQLLNGLANPLQLARGGTDADLSATGGVGQFLKQLSAGADVTVDTILASEIPSGIDAAKIADGSVNNDEFQTLDGMRTDEQIQTQLDQRLTWPVARRFWAATLDADSGVGTGGVVGLGCTGILVSALPANADDATGAWSRFSSTAAAQLQGLLAGCAVAGFSGRLFRRKFGLTFLARIRTGSDLTSQRIFIGLKDSAPAAAAGDNPAGDYAMLRFSAATDSGWVGVCKDNTTQQVTAQVAAIAVDTEYLVKVRISADAATIYYSVNGSAELSLATNLPRNTVTLGMVATIHSTVAGTRYFDFSAMQAVPTANPVVI